MNISINIAIIYMFGSEKMKTLFISTFNQKVIIGLIIKDELIIEEEVISNKSHSLTLIPTIDNILKKSNTNIKDLEEIIVINGPGSFTGVRLGVTVAKTLSYTLKIKIKTITSIKAIALSNNISKKIIAISDSKGKYYGIFNDNKLIDEINYLNLNQYNELIKKYSDYKIIEKENIDIIKVHQYLKDAENINPHLVNPVYIKKIEVLNGK